MKNKLSAVTEFHKAFGLGVNNKPTTDIDKSTMNLRFSLMDEENKEYLEAIKNNDMIEVASVQPYFHWVWHSSLKIYEHSKSMFQMIS